MPKRFLVKSLNQIQIESQMQMESNMGHILSMEKYGTQMGNSNGIYLH